MIMVLLIMVEVILRNLFGISTLIADEMSGYLLVVIVFWGATISFESESFVRVEVLYSKYGPKIRKIMDCLFLFFAIVFSVTLSIFLWKLTIDSLRLNSTSNSIVQTPLFIPQLFMSFGIGLFDLYLVLKWVQRLFLGR
jgi:TRAP-type C4-dicarboxylate transport system permease small subunit